MKCALVTGGSRGLGRAISVALAKDMDYHILINYQGNEAAAKETLHPDQLIWVVVGDRAKIEPELAQLGFSEIRHIDVDGNSIDAP